MVDNYKGRGDAVNHIAAGTITSGDVVVLKHCIGIALSDAVADDIIAVQIEGIVNVPKASAAVFAQGEKLIWDTSVSKFDDSSATPATGDITGACVAAVAGLATELTARVKLTPGNATLT